MIITFKGVISYIIPFFLFWWCVFLYNIMITYLSMIIQEEQKRHLDILMLY